MNAPGNIGYCPYCGVTLRVESDSTQGAYQITCLCRNVMIPFRDVPGLQNLRRVWEITVKLRTKYDG